MVDSRKAALVFDEGRLVGSRKPALGFYEGTLVGIFGCKDMMIRVISKGLLLNATLFSAVMTPNPEFLALQTMHDYKFLTLPPVFEDGYRETRE